MGYNYDEGAKRKTIDVWICVTCGRAWPVESKQPGWTAEDAEKAARTCCSRNSPCPFCKTNRTKYPSHACESCAPKLERERWEKCRVLPLDFPLCLQDGDEWFWSEDDLWDYCDEHEAKPQDLLLRIGEKKPAPEFNPDEFWADYLPEDAEPLKCQELTDAINRWARENIDNWQMSPYRPDLSAFG